ncbi:MAG: tRNA (adenosine(37)-N6)-threonylcarbamoyltransferase complex ATPase subunit type 1 TsaE [Bacillota bacterium]|jgi:tRNA threonylcarbamoyladenosine biosynthesis protein TsaE|nr:tRNA (adenosine(37)-N6)-threonylcarbamoyltransferase complex ATPase subunit type 1 TsaE [Bacillota bacterium]HOP70058.1 tRNA (adenosine(37)-N6)-threonylcarbamoyltransferase complex ATPase subunit type 1 TsaE [Bacillota bacterium]HPZ84815.1 tRNA (adenosine(37)-N6)-threonylcarbamoyltransferase complex ATPase subunit type 1 TsaE [Bacillota bacterium]HQD85371.1 tRNA (adenosine(37)-N6)-threonylcarbamoyltransferase complex ATPase subunit type 1 TsaE [Bacillota bacterium]
MMQESNTARRTFLVESADETRYLGMLLGSELEGGEVILLEGTLGAGKTTMVQGIAAGLGIHEPVKSPSFVLERIYWGRLVLHHFDFYRLTQEDIMEAGLLYDIDESAVVVIEWPERAGEALQGWTLKVTIEFYDEPVNSTRVIAENKRKITLESSDVRWVEVIEAIWRHTQQHA